MSPRRPSASPAGETAAAAAVAERRSGLALGPGGPPIRAGGRAARAGAIAPGRVADTARPARQPAKASAPIQAGPTPKARCRRLGLVPQPAAARRSTPLSARASADVRQLAV